MTYHHLGRDEDARRVEQKLRNFEPKYAATLRRDIEQTPPAASDVGGQTTKTAISKEVIATPV